MGLSANTTDGLLSCLKPVSGFSLKETEEIIKLQLSTLNPPIQLINTEKVQIHYLELERKCLILTAKPTSLIIHSAVL